MPTFCRHNRLLHNCPICAREQAVEMRPVISSGPSAAPPAPGARPGTHGAPRRASTAGASARAEGRGVRIRRLARGVEDGYLNRLVPGLHSSEEAVRLADELAVAAGRLELLAADPWDLYAEVADPTGDAEERIWLCFQLACIAAVPGDDPWALVRAHRTSWASGEDPRLEGELGVRGVRSVERVFGAYRAWAARAGSQLAAFSGEPSWNPERRFARVYERLALPGLERGPRFELLTLLGVLGIAELNAAALVLVGNDDVTIAAKRAFGIGDALLLERRASDLATAADVPLAALDLALWSWSKGERPPGVPDGLAAGAPHAALRVPEPGVADSEPAE